MKETIVNALNNVTLAMEQSHHHLSSRGKFLLIFISNIYFLYVSVPRIRILGGVPVRNAHERKWN